MTAKPSSWPPQPGDGPYIDRLGGQWLPVAVGKLRRLGDDDPGAVHDADTIWNTRGPLITPRQARDRAAALRRDAHETECRTGRTADVDSDVPALADAARAYQRAEVIWP
jgi:hypothetical protein